jgi:hypothetical protein
MVLLNGSASAQRTEDRLLLWHCRSAAKPVAFGHGQGELKRVDRVQRGPPPNRRTGSTSLADKPAVQAADDEFGKFTFRGVWVPINSFLKPAARAAMMAQRTGGRRGCFPRVQTDGRICFN